MSKNLSTHVPWCEEADGHAAVHHRYIGEVHLDRYNEPRVILVTVECGAAETIPLPVLRFATELGGSSVAVARLTWAQSNALTALLADAAKRYSS